MGNSEIREPKQRRSIEKKNRIIAAGHKLFCEKGYHNTNTAEIAKAAGVSTGIVYNYFNDKKDIFIAGIEQYAASMSDPMFEMLSKLSQPYDLPDVIRKIINFFIQSHYVSVGAHEEMLAMSHSDKDVAKIFRDFETDMGNKLVQVLIQNGINTSNPNEKIHITIGLIENLCHEIVYYKNPALNYDEMKEEVVKIVTNLFIT